MKPWLAALLAFGLAARAAAVEPRTAQEATVFARDHCKQLPAATALDSRYLWLPRRDAQARREWWQVVSGWVHGQSREAGIYPPPVVIDTDQGPREVNPFSLKENPGPDELGWRQAVLIRVQLSLYRFSPKVWERFAFQHPFMHRVHYWTGGYEPTFSAAPWMSETKEQYDAVVQLQALTQSIVPLLRADNWYWQTAITHGRKVGYHGLLEITDQKSYERAIGFDPKANVDRAFLDELLAAVSAADSGVSQQNRRVERLEKIKGAYWRTKESDLSIEGDAFDPLATLDGRLRFRAIEAFGHNACGFWVTGLFDDAGKSQDSAPDFIGYNHGAGGNDGKIHNGYVCFQCHDDGGLQDVKCHFRARAAGKRGLFPQTTLFKSLPALLRYLPPIEDYLAADRARYAAALWRATGLKPQQFALLLRDKYREYDGPVDVNRAAEDLGTTPEELKARFAKYVESAKNIDTILSAFADEPTGKLGIESWHKRVNAAHLVLRGFVEWPKK